jgi:branched-chain amino acid transport system permease protein
VVILGLIYVLLGLGLNIVVGRPACSTWVMWRSTPSVPTVWRWVSVPGLGFWTVLPLAAITAGLAGCILGSRCCDAR